MKTNTSSNVRATPAGSILGQQSSGRQGTITSGPQSANLNGAPHKWWYIDFDSGVDGWVSESLLDLLVSPPGSFSLNSATPGCSGGTPQINLSWSSSSGATSYDVYRNGELYRASLTGTSFLNSANVTAGQNYSYFIRARNAGGTRDTSTLSATVSCGSIPGAFTLLSATPRCVGTSSEVRLSWTQASGATSYQVFRNGAFYQATLANEFMFDNRGSLVVPGTTYSYKMVAVNASGTRETGTLSATAPATCSTGSSFDLTASASLSSSYSPGQVSVFVPVTVSRSGGSIPNSGPYVHAQLRWSTNTTYETSDALLWDSNNGSTPDFPVGVLNSSGSKTVTATIAIPNVSPGTYYILAVVDPNNFYSESNKTNNTTAHQVQVANATGYDLRVTAQPPGNVNSGQGSVTVPITVTRSGTSMPSSASYVTARLYWSSDSTYDNGDSLRWESSTADFPVSTLNANGAKTVNAVISIPSSLSTGTYYVIAYVDQSNVFSNESNESNNTSSHGVSVAGGTDAGVISSEAPPDRAQVPGGQTYTKQFDLRNTGTTTWNTNYRLVYLDGEAGCSKSTRFLNQSVAPGATYWFEISCTAPTATATHSQRFQLLNASGAAIPIQGSTSIWVRIRVLQPTASATWGHNFPNSGFSEDPINTATGNYSYHHVDLQMPGRGFPFEFERTYNSMDPAAGPMGIGWSHSFMSSLTENPDGSVTARLHDGQVLTFDSTAASTFVVRNNNAYATLSRTGTGSYTLTTPAFMTLVFGSGRLTSMADRNGNAVQLTYSGSTLTSIRDTADRVIQIASDSQGRMTSLTDPLGRVVRYTYDGSNRMTSFVDARGGTWDFAYDSSNRMLAAVNPNGQTILRNTYNSEGRVASQSDGANNTWSYSYNTSSRVTTITDPNGKTTQHLHDGNFQLLRATDSFGNYDEYQYDSDGNRTQVRDRNGNITQYKYDSRGNIISTTDANTRATAATYDGQNNPLTKTDQIGRVTAFEYDAAGNVVRQIDATGAVTAYAYDRGLMLSKTDAENRTTRYAYDAAGNLIQLTDPANNVTRYTYDAVGRRLTTVDGVGVTTSTTYDANDNVVSTTDGVKGLTQHLYDGAGNKTRTTDPRGKVTNYTYDGNGKLTETADALGNRVINTYDTTRNLATVRDPRGNVTTHAYDSENRLIRTTDALSRVTTYTYDAAGNKTRVTDPLNNVTRFAYDGLNRLTSTTDARGVETQTVYDSVGQVVIEIDAASRVTVHGYDAAGRQVSVTNPAGGVVEFEYDMVGNRTAITDPNGSVTRFTYDALDRVTTITDPVGNVTANQYDAVGNLSSVKDGNGNIRTFTYDGNRRQTRIAFSTGSAVGFVYDANGNRTQMIDPLGVSQYNYDDLNRLTSHISPYGAGLSFTYDAASNRTSIQYPGARTVQYTYDALNRIATVRDWNAIVATNTYDAAGRLTGVTYSNGLASDYTYDAVGQNLTIRHRNGSTPFYSETTAWSGTGNPVSSDISGLAAPALSSSVETYTYNGAGQLSSTSAGSTIHDGNGNLTRQPESGGASTSFAYDQNNRVIRVFAPGSTTAIGYFGDGRVASVEREGGVARYLHDPASSRNQILAEVTPAGVMQVGYVHGSGGMLSQIRSDGTYLHFHNLQGSVVAIANAAGAVVNSYRFDPFGGLLPTSTEQITNAFTFLGSYSVIRLGDYQLTGNRLYDPEAGRFTSPDQLRYADPAFSAFAYSRQSPLGLIDPTGLAPEVTRQSAAMSALLAKHGLKEAHLEQGGPQLRAAPKEPGITFEELETWTRENRVRIIFGAGAGEVMAEVIAEVLKDLWNGEFTFSRRKTLRPAPERAEALRKLSEKCFPMYEMVGLDYRGGGCR